MQALPPPQARPKGQAKAVTEGVPVIFVTSMHALFDNEVQPFFELSGPLRRRRKAALIKSNDSAYSCSAAPALAAPSKALGEGINLIVVPTGKSEQLSNEFLKPSSALRGDELILLQTDRSEQSIERVCQYLAYRS